MVNDKWLMILTVLLSYMFYGFLYSLLIAFTGLAVAALIA